MSDNVGLTTPRGSGTSGFVQRNLAHIRPRDKAAPYPPRDRDSLRHRPRQPDKSILEHERKHQIEVEVTILRDKLEEENEELEPENQKTEEEIDEDCNKLRKQIEERDEQKETRRQFKSHQVHEMADAKQKEMDRMGKAFKIPSNYEEGSHWRKQEERLRGALDRNDQDNDKRRGD